MATTIQMIGEQLRAERKQQGLSIEDVAHTTRIHADTIYNLEADDYSSFSSTAYAKSFLKKYAAHLGVDASEALEQFASDATSPIVGGANYIRSVVDAIEPVERISGLRDSGNFAQIAAEPKRRSTPSERGGPPIVLGLFLVLVLAAIPVIVIIGKGAGSIDDAKRNLSETFGIGKDDGNGNTAETTASNPAAEVKAGPGTRVAPAAPLTRSVVQISDPEENHDLDRFVPGGSPLTVPSEKADTPQAGTDSEAPAPSKPPIVAKPVVLPISEDA